MKGKATKTRIVTWWVVNIGMLFLLFFALVHGEVKCTNVVKFAIWFNFVISIIILFAPKKTHKQIKDKGFPVYEWVNLSYGLGFCFTLAAYGWFWYATMDVICLLIQQSIYFGNDE